MKQQFELMPFESAENELENFKQGSEIAVTTSPKLGVNRTVEFAEMVESRGFESIPHIASRYIEDEDHADQLFQRLSEAGTNNVFIPAGDLEESRGPFDSSYKLLRFLNSNGFEFDHVGITGYPEGHQFISDEELWNSLDKKSQYADYIVTQICFDPEVIQRWCEEVRDRGYNHDILVGVPGVIEMEKMVSIARKVGVGESLKFVRKTTGVMDFAKSLLGSKGRYKPSEVTDHFNSETSIHSGYHFYTFNRVQPTLDWVEESGLDKRIR